MAIVLALSLIDGVAWCQNAEGPAATATSDSQHQQKSRSGEDSAKKDPSPQTHELQPGEDPENRLLLPFIKHVIGDQQAFWTSPLHWQKKDLKWILPGAGVTAAFVSTDSWLSKQVPLNHIDTSKKISDYGAYSFIALGGASYIFGHMTHNDHLSETGLLAGEAAINATGVAYAFKEITQRQRPYLGNEHGNFWAGGDSFPSEHSAIAWSVASVWAHEYPGWLSQMAAYGLASSVTLTRVTARQHFPSDAIVGSVLGWYFGRQVYRAHHDQDLGGSAWGNMFGEDLGERERDPNSMGSPYVPLDSWVYPALERLIAMGYIHSNVLGMRPWTRMACARLLDEADSELATTGEAGTAGKIYATLRAEFEPEIARLNGSPNIGMQLQSVYSRAMGISGTPLRDGFHFGQTITNDYGRPYWEGFNNVTGFTADGEAGPLSVYVRGEYQHAPAMPAYSPSVLAATAAADFTPTLANGTGVVDRFALLDSNVSLTINNLQISFGKQSIWLGPGESGSLQMSNNAAPFAMVKIDEVAPHEIPGLSRLLGPSRAEFFVGQLSGHHWEYCVVSTCQSYPGYPDVVGPNISPQPFIQGGKISFQPTRNLEFGMGMTAMFGGPGLPVTFGNFFRTYYAHTPQDLSKNPGKRFSAADVTYKVPGARNWLTLYLDAMTWDEISPIGSTRANVNPGIHMAAVPKIPKLELRAEGYNISRTTHSGQFVQGWVYYNADRYRSGYVNDGNLLGSWIGRAGRGGQGWATYWFSARNKVQASYRLQTVSPAFLGGGRLADYSAQGDFMLGSDVSLSGLFQYEQWRFPTISLQRQSDETVSAQLTLYPHLRIRK